MLQAGDTAGSERSKHLIERFRKRTEVVPPYPVGTPFIVTEEP